MNCEIPSIVYRSSGFLLTLFDFLKMQQKSYLSLRDSQEIQNVFAEFSRYFRETIWNCSVQAFCIQPVLSKINVGKNTDSNN